MSVDGGFRNISTKNYGSELSFFSLKYQKVVPNHHPDANNHDYVYHNHHSDANNHDYVHRNHHSDAHFDKEQYYKKKINPQLGTNNEYAL